MKALKNKNKKSKIEEKIVKKRYWGRYVFLFFVILVLVAVFMVYQFMQKPAQGVIRPQSQVSQLEKEAVDVPELFSGKYLSFMYSNKYALKSNEVFDKDGAVILEQAYLSETTAISKKIGLTVRSLPTHNLDDNPDYRMRKTAPKKYLAEAFMEGNVDGVSFIPLDDGQFEKTFFIIHGDLLAIISMTAPSSPNEDLNKEANLIIKSVTWKK